MRSREELASLIADLLNRFEVYPNGPLDPEEIDKDNLADTLGGCEGYSMAFNQTVYVVFPDDVQDLLLSLASAIYSDEEDEDDLLWEEE